MIQFVSTGGITSEMREKLSHAFGKTRALPAAFGACAHQQRMTSVVLYAVRGDARTSRESDEWKTKSHNLGAVLLPPPPSPPSPLLPPNALAPYFSTRAASVRDRNA